MKKLTRYQKRQRAGQRERAKFIKYRQRYQDIAIVFSGLAAGGGFVLIMGLAKGYNTVAEIVAAYAITTFIGVALSFREYFVIKASWRYWVLRIQNN